MTLIPCPECGRSISDQARSCPNCGHPLVAPLGARLEVAWREGFRHAWMAAVGLPGILLVRELVADPVILTSNTLAHMLPWALILGVNGFMVGAVAIGVAALIRGRVSSSGDLRDAWRWSIPVVLTVVAAFGAWTGMVM